MYLPSSAKSLVVMVLVVLISNGFCTSIVAAPLTFVFEATVDPLPPFNGDVNLPFTLEEGSVIDGQFTFDPDIDPEPSPTSARTYIQPFSFEFSFDGFSFGAEQYEARVNNDSGIVDGPNAGPADFIAFGCSATSLDVDCNSQPLQFPGSPPLEFSMAGTLAGAVTLLAESRLSSDVNVWNEFTIIRNMRIAFATNTGEGQLFDTTLSDFVLVPEPTTVHILLGSLIFLMLKYVRNVRQINT